jgi:hypothetical protein
MDNLWDSMKGFVNNNNTPQGPSDETLFRNSTDQLSPEQMGYSTTDNSSPLDRIDHKKYGSAQPPRAKKSILEDTNTLSNIELNLAREKEERENIPSGEKLITGVRRHIDGMRESKDLLWDMSKGPRPSLVQEHEVRNSFEFLTHFNIVVDLFEKKYPTVQLRPTNFQIIPTPGKPFLCETTAYDCVISPLALAKSEPLLRKFFRILTPAYQEQPRKLIELTDSLYYSPNRIQFVIAKTLSEFTRGLIVPLTLIKLQLLSFFPERYKVHRIKKENYSDAMAASLHLNLALGGLEHVTKLHHFYLQYPFDIPADNDAIFAADRFMNLLGILETDYGLSPKDALQRALAKEAFITDNPSFVIQAANDILEKENKKQQDIINAMNKTKNQGTNV